MRARRCLALVLSFVSTPAFAAVPTVLDVDLVHPSFDGAPNTLMVEATVTVDDVGDDALHDATVGYVQASDYAACDETTAWKYSADVQRFDDGDTRTWTLYNFVPETTYRYVVRTGSAAAYRYSCGRLPRPTLPGPLAALNFQYEAAGRLHPFETRYVVVNLDDCGGSDAHANLFVLDAVNQSIVWYLDMTAMTGLPDATITGWRYQPATDSAPERILAIIDRRYLYEWGFDGALRNFQDLAPLGECDGTSDARGPCAHHDILTDDDGITYVLTGRASSLPTTGTDWAACSSRFVNDGYRMLDGDFEPIESQYLMTDYGYDPAADGGPNVPTTVLADADACSANTWAPYLGGEVIDWTHVNSLDRSTDGSQEVLDLSVRSWDQILRLDANDGSYLWRLASEPAYSDWRLRLAPGIEGRRGFAGQHDVHTVAPNTLLMLDNTGDPQGSRVLRISLDDGVATIDRSWALVDSAGRPLECLVEGSAQEVPGTSGEHVLAVCNDAYTIVELDDSSGYATGDTIEPPLVISLPDGAVCTSGGPTGRDVLRGLYRAFPLDAVGSFD